MHSLMVESLAAPSTPTRPAPALAAYSTSMRPASMVFRSAKIELVGKRRLELAHRVQALGLDQRRARFDPVDAAGDGLARHLEGARQVDEVERHLHDDAPAALAAGGAHTPITWTISRRSRGRASKSQKTMVWKLAQREAAVDERHGHRGADQAGAHVRVAVAVAQVVVVRRSGGRAA